jgi:hypothetical protein
LYDAITVIIERGLIQRREWNLIISPHLLREFGTREQFADVHKLYPVQRGIEYGRFVEWAAAPLPDYHHDPLHGVTLKNVTMRGAPLLGADRPREASFDVGDSRGGEQLSNGYGDVGGWGSGMNNDEREFLPAFGGDGEDIGESQYDADGRAPLGGKSAEAQKQAELKARAGRRGGGAARRRALHKKKLSKTKSNGYGEKGVTGTGDGNFEYDEFGNEMSMVEGDFTKEDEAYFHELSMSFNVGTFEAAQKESEKKAQMEKVVAAQAEADGNNNDKNIKNQKNNRVGGNGLSSVDEKTNNRDSGTAVLQSLPSVAPDESERPSSQGAMFLSPGLAREAAGLESGMAMNTQNNDGALAAAGVGTADVWTWDDEQDGGGDSFFGSKGDDSPGKANSAFMLSGGAAPQPQPPASLPPRNSFGRSPMQKRVVR